MIYHTIIVVLKVEIIVKSKMVENSGEIAVSNKILP